MHRSRLFLTGPPCAQAPAITATIALSPTRRSSPPVRLTNRTYPKHRTYTYSAQTDSATPGPGPSLRSQTADLGPAHFVDRFAHVPGDLEAFGNVQRMAGPVGDDPKIRLPHVATDQVEHRCALGAEPARKRQQGLTYVARTRAHDQLSIDPVEPASQFLDDLRGFQRDAPTQTVDFSFSRFGSAPGSPNSTRR